MSAPPPEDLVALRAAGKAPTTPQLTQSEPRTKTTKSVSVLARCPYRNYSGAHTTSTESCPILKCSFSRSLSNCSSFVFACPGPNTPELPLDDERILVLDGDPIPPDEFFGS